MRRFASGDQLNEVFGLAAGLDDRCLKQPCKQTLLTPHTLIPAGSVTKAFTGAATLRFVDKGVLGLDTLAHTLVDPVLARQGQPTMAELWDGNAQVNRITVRDLLAMTSGIADYDGKDPGVRPLAVFLRNPRSLHLPLGDPLALVP